MNPTIETLLTHQSIRKFKDTHIDETILANILEAANHGSTMGNMQLYSIIVIRDKNRMQAMANLHFNQPIATNAPAILIFCADFHRFNQYCHFRNADTSAYSNLQAYQWAVTDALIAAQNACVAAEAQQLGICWLGTITYNVDQFISILKLPKQVIPVACIAMGYPDEKPEKIGKLETSAIVHDEYYHEYDEARINHEYAATEMHPETIKILKDNNLENLAKVMTEIRYRKEDNEHFSTILAKSIKDQGFEF